MALHYILVLALVQGITEFLPISSSGHLYLTGEFIGTEDQGLTMDIAVHFGTLFAVMMYFWRDVWTMIKGTGRLATFRPNKDSKLVVNIVIGTIPVVLAGFFLYDYVEGYLRDIKVVAWTTLGFGILLWIADKVGMTIRRTEHLGIPSALVIGLAQVLALIPGTSRSGITMTAARFMGMERAESARFSMLLSIPTILAAGSLGAYKLWQSGNMALTYDAILAAVISFFAAWLTIIVLMAWLRRASYTPFVLYRIALGGYLLYYIYY
ncbi:undecaprenyl-diphosphate phosphatase [Curvivirga sp.]|uniref:undecaprenyl-diphosphate phosphatase n=1 Tax=Curvivirga sp. TaxID=2856848 RepID=UPI003B5C650A